jgi:hypothetical protein
LRQAIQSRLNADVDLVDYIGHGAIDRFGNSGHLTSADAAELQNAAGAIVVIAPTGLSVNQDASRIPPHSLWVVIPPLS